MGTFNNNIATMSAGCVVLSEIFTSDAAITLTARGEELRGRIDDVLHQHKLPLTITGFGSMNAIHAARTATAKWFRSARPGSVPTRSNLPRIAATRRVHRTAWQPQPRPSSDGMGPRPLLQRARRVARRTGRPAVEQIHRSATFVDPALFDRVLGRHDGRSTTPPMRPGYASQTCRI